MAQEQRFGEACWLHLRPVRVGCVKAKYLSEWIGVVMEIG
jgi:hypothetical protein